MNRHKLACYWNFVCILPWALLAWIAGPEEGPAKRTAYDYVIAVVLGGLLVAVVLTVGKVVWIECH